MSDDLNRRENYHYEQSSDDVELNIMDLFWFILSKWKTAIIPAIIMAVILGGFGAYRAWKAYNNKGAQYTVDKFLKEAKENEISDDKINDMNVAARHIAKYYEQIQIQNAFVEESPLQKIDWQRTVKMDSYYLIQLKDNSSYAQVKTLADACRAYLSSSAVSEPIAESLGYDVRYISDLLDVRYEIPQIMNNVIAGTESVPSSTTVNVDTFTLIITAKANSEATCKVLLSGAEQGLFKMQDTFSKQIVENEVSYIQTTSNIVRDTDIRDKQLEQSITDVQYYYDQIKLETHEENGTAKFTDDELEYIEAKAILYEYQAGTRVEAEDTSVLDLISVKFIVLGIALGLFVTLIYWAVRYIAGSNLTSPEALSDNYRIRTMLRAGSQKALRGIDRLIFKNRFTGNRIMTDAETGEILAAELKSIASERNLKKVVLTGADFGRQEDSIASAVREKLSADGITVISGDQIMYSADLITDVAGSDLCILMETLERSLKGMVEKEVEFMAEHGIPIYACVMNVRPER